MRLRLDPTAPYGVSPVPDMPKATRRGGHGYLGESGVQTVVAGSNITIDATDPKHPIVSSSGGGGGSGDSITDGTTTLAVAPAASPFGSGYLTLSDSLSAGEQGFVADGWLGLYANGMATSAPFFELTDYHIVANGRDSTSQFRAYVEGGFALRTTNHYATILSSNLAADATFKLPATTMDSSFVVVEDDGTLVLGGASGDLLIDGDFQFGHASLKNDNLTADRIFQFPDVAGTVALTSDITTAVNSLINSAPGALDTLDELAAALGDDANFATTVTNSLALKAPLASPTFTGTITAPNITATGTLLNTGDVRFSGYLRVGSTTAPTATTAGNLTVDTLISVARDEASGTTGRFWKGSGTMTNTVNGADYYMHMQPTIAPASNSLTDFRLLGFDGIVAPATTITLDTLIAGYFQMRLRHDGATNDIIGAQAFGAVIDSSSAATVGTVTLARGFHAGIYNRASGTSVISITTGVAYDVSSSVLSAGATVGTGIGLRVQNPNAPTAMTTWIGADFGAFTRATTDNIGVRIATPSGATNNYALQLSGTGGTAASGITFGTDLQLYRVAASVLVNSGSERIATYLNVGAITAPANTTAGDLSFIRGFMTGNLTITDANIVLSATTGTKIGTATTQKLGFYNATPIVQPSAYTVSNPSTDRAYDVASTSVNELAAVLGTLITDLKSLGLIG